MEENNIYTFSLIADSKCGLWINGKNVIALGNNGEGEITLEAGRYYAVMLKYVDHGGDARAVLHWSHTRPEKQVVPPNVFYHSKKDKLVEDK